MRTIGVLPKSVLILEYLGMILLALALLSLNHYLTLPAPFNTPLAGVLMVFLGVVCPILTPLFPVLVRPLPFMVPLRYVSLSYWVAIR